ncbi:MAG: VF530 family DNA-binding protein [Candidatus Xenobiia bacterium LiM19]
MADNKNKDPLHGVTLEMILNYLVEKYGWEEMAGRIRINCFAKDPSIKSSLKFLRRTPWARAKVECLYLEAVKCRGASRHTTDGSRF